MVLKYRFGFSVLLAAALAPAPVFAAAKGDPAAGEQRTQACGGCHGAKGVSTMAGVPSLAGQQDNFLQWQLVFFRSGRRANPIMTPISQGLSDEDVRNIGAYYATLAPRAAAAPGADQAQAPAGGDQVKAPAGEEQVKAPVGAGQAEAALIEPGKEVATEHHCSTCHMDTFVGKAAAARIAGQRADYLEHALADYRSAARPSTGVAAMNEAAAGLTDPEIKELAAYLASLQ